MQCVILAGGLATRMRPLTDTIPKAMVPVHGVPFADIQLRWLASQGVEDVVYAIGYRGEQIRDHVDQHLPPQEREALSGLLQSTMLRRSEGLAVDPFAMMALLAALDWAEQSLVWGNTLAQAVAAAPDLAAVQAVSAETAIAALKPPPVVTAGEIATALRRTPPES